MKILFVCTGNTCRSPMAEGIFRKMTQDNEEEKSFYCMSMGIAAVDGMPASENAVKACEEIGVDISRHRSRSMANMDNLNAFDVFVVMTDTHAYVLQQAGIPVNKLYVLGREITDPYGRSLNTYRKCRDAIQWALKDWYHMLKSEYGE